VTKPVSVKRGMKNVPLSCLVLRLDQRIEALRFVGESQTALYLEEVKLCIEDAVEASALEERA
jgi:hypothetical protein